MGQSRPHPQNGASILRKETLSFLPVRTDPPVHTETQPGEALGFLCQATSILSAGPVLMPRPDISAPWLSPPGHGQVILLIAQAGTEELLSPFPKVFQEIKSKR